jgi:hypothetical protein
MSDQQLVTGTALLIVAFYQLPMENGHITVYHFSIVSDLAWFSSSVHLTACFMLSDYLIKQPALKFWRAIWMLILGGFLLAAVIISSHQDWYDRFSCPADCLKQTLKGNIVDTNKSWLIAYVLFIVYGYTAALVPLFAPTKRLWKAFHKAIKVLYKKLEPGSSNPWQYWLRGLHTELGWLARFVYEVFSSNFLSIIFGIVWFLLGVENLLIDREYGAALLKSAGRDENAWGFGQVVPLLLVALPLFLAGEVVFRLYLFDYPNEPQNRHQNTKLPNGPMLITTQMKVKKLVLTQVLTSGVLPARTTREGH